ncbi:helix-turn-helix transcriptional regulator [Desulfoluna spongiiphila]|uniref:helix-turn-helix transcriptional regulator n=1 Tax=Desulfoluna spongiiphila TaxID=419481 RepID=UPI001251781E|nr:AraC family transcriptional regulator [Desulfoluna spongiiphila]VVS94562.1 transcription regulator hth arac- type [Desulfoluna spongiiphila]
MERDMFQERPEDDDAAFFCSDYRKTSETSPYGEVTSSFAGLKEDSGCYEVIPIRCGLYLTVGRFCASRPLVLDFEIAGAPIDFEYWLSGSGECRLQGLGPSPSVLQSGAGAMNASYAPDTSGRCLSVGDADICIVGLSVDPVLLYTLAGDDAAGFPHRLRPTSEGRVRDKFTLKGSLCPAMQSACHQILTCPFTGGCRDLFLESKALELLSLQVNALSSSPDASGRGLTRRDTDRIHDARDCLISDLKHPPTIAMLARQTGINETKLKAGFRSVYGTTIFDYLRRHKMEVARIWLEEGGKNVSEAAYDVGYSNVSHFIRAYRTVFGVNPGDYVRRNRLVMS